MSVASPVVVWGVEEATGDWLFPSAITPGLGLIIVLMRGAKEEGRLGGTNGDLCERGMGTWPGMNGGKGCWVRELEISHIFNVHTHVLKPIHCCLQNQQRVIQICNREPV